MSPSEATVINATLNGTLRRPDASALTNTQRRHFLSAVNVIASNISQLLRQASSAYLLRNLRVLGSEVDNAIARDTALEHVKCIQRWVSNVHNRQIAVHHAAALQQLLTDVMPFRACAFLQALEDLCAKAHEALNPGGSVGTPPVLSRPSGASATPPATDSQRMRQSPPHSVINSFANLPSGREGRNPPTLGCGLERLRLN